MEIIEELEPTRRGLYGGIVGYLDFAGDADTAIAIRTALVRDGVAYVQAGGGIVADSDPVAEDAECLNKARAVLSAVATAATLASRGPGRDGTARASAGPPDRVASVRPRGPLSRAGPARSAVVGVRGSAGAARAALGRLGRWPGVELTPAAGRPRGQLTGAAVAPCRSPVALRRAGRGRPRWSPPAGCCAAWSGCWWPGRRGAAAIAGAALRRSVRRRRPGATGRAAAGRAARRRARAAGRRRPAPLLARGRAALLLARRAVRAGREPRLARLGARYGAPAGRGAPSRPGPGGLAGAGRRRAIPPPARADRRRADPGDAAGTALSSMVSPSRTSSPMVGTGGRSRPESGQQPRGGRPHMEQPRRQRPRVHRGRCPGGPRGARGRGRLRRDQAPGRRRAATAGRAGRAARPGIGVIAEVKRASPSRGRAGRHRRSGRAGQGRTPPAAPG